MKLSDRRLKRLFRENPVPLQPKKKPETLELARKCGTTDIMKETEDGSTMKYIRTGNIRTLIAAAAILSLMAVAVTAGIVNYCYHTPGGNIVDQNGTIIAAPGDITLKMTEETIDGEGYTITEVNWTSAGGSSTLTVWTTADSTDLTGLRAVIGETEYPLAKRFVTKDENGSPLNIGYTAVDVPEPESDTVQNKGLRLVIDEPRQWHSIFFVPDDFVILKDTDRDVTVTAACYDGRLYLGSTDNALENSVLKDYITYNSYGL